MAPHLSPGLYCFDTRDALLRHIQTVLGGLIIFSSSTFCRRFGLAAFGDEARPDKQNGDAHRLLREGEVQWTHRQHRRVSVADLHGHGSIAEHHAFDALQLINIKILNPVFRREFC